MDRQVSLQKTQCSGTTFVAGDASISAVVNGGCAVGNTFPKEYTAWIPVASRIKLEYISSKRGPCFLRLKDQM